MRDHKLGDAQRAWEVIRPVISLLLWLLPEHIIITAPSAAEKEASAVTSQKSLLKGNSGAHATAEGLSSAVRYIKAVAPVSI
jgi:hypothetical protein